MVIFHRFLFHMIEYIETYEQKLFHHQGNLMKIILYIKAIDYLH